MEKWIVAAAAVGLVLFGFVFLAFSRYVDKKVNTRKQNCTVPAKALIIGINKERRRLSTGDYHNFYHPIYEYVANGEKIQVQSYVGVEIDKFQVGQDVDLLYNPTNPQEYYCARENVSKVSTIFNIVTYSTWAIALGLLVLTIFVL